MAGRPDPKPARSRHCTRSRGEELLTSVESAQCQGLSEEETPAGKIAPCRVGLGGL